MRALPILLMVAQGFSIWSLWRRGLTGRFAWLSAYLAASMVEILILGQLSPRTPEYLVWWIRLTALLVGVQAGVAAEAWHMAVSDAPGIGRATHRAAWLAALAGGIMMGALRWEKSLGGVASVQLGAAVGLAAGVIASAILMAMLHIPRTPGVVAHAWILTIHYSGLALFLVLVQSGFGWASAANAWLSIGCCLAWAGLPKDAPRAAESSGDPVAAAEFLSVRDRLSGLFR